MVAKLKAYFIKAVYLTLAFTIVFLLFKSGTIYVKLNKYSVKIGIDLERKAPYMSDDIDKSIRDSEEAILSAEPYIEDARRRGFLD